MPSRRNVMKEVLVRLSEQKAHILFVTMAILTVEIHSLFYVRATETDTDALHNLTEVLHILLLLSSLAFCLSAYATGRFGCFPECKPHDVAFDTFVGGLLAMKSALTLSRTADDAGSFREQLGTFYGGVRAGASLLFWFRGAYIWGVYARYGLITLTVPTDRCGQAKVDKSLWASNRRSTTIRSTLHSMGVMRSSRSMRHIRSMMHSMGAIRSMRSMRYTRATYQTSGLGPFLLHVSASRAAQALGQALVWVDFVLLFVLYTWPFQMYSADVSSSQELDVALHACVFVLDLGIFLVTKASEKLITVSSQRIHIFPLSLVILDMTCLALDVVVLLDASGTRTAGSRQACLECRLVRFTVCQLLIQSQAARVDRAINMHHKRASDAGDRPQSPTSEIYDISSKGPTKMPSPNPNLIRLFNLIRLVLNYSRVLNKFEAEETQKEQQVEEAQKEQQVEKAQKEQQLEEAQKKQQVEDAQKEQQVEQAQSAAEPLAHTHTSPAPEQGLLKYSPSAKFTHGLLRDIAACEVSGAEQFKDEEPGSVSEGRSRALERSKAESLVMGPEEMSCSEDMLAQLLHRASAEHLASTTRGRVSRSQSISLKQAWNAAGFNDSIEHSAERPLRILACDGGGMKGLALAEMLQCVEERCGAPVSQLFDFVCGTSTGGVIAAHILICREQAIQRYRRLVWTKVRELFLHSSLSNLFFRGAKVSDQAVERFLKCDLTKALNVDMETPFPRPVEDAPAAMRVPHTFVTLTCHSASKNRWEPFLCRNYKLPSRDVATHSAGTDSWPAVQALQGTTAAPTYFPPLEMAGQTYADGGLAANNPAALGVLEALSIWPTRKVACILSLGCGKTIKPGTASNSVLYWAGTLMDVALSTHKTHMEMKMLVRTMPSQPCYVRLEPPTGDVAMDESRLPALNELVHTTQEYMKRKQRKVDRLCLALLLAERPEKVRTYLKPLLSPDADEHDICGALYLLAGDHASNGSVNGRLARPSHDVTS